VKHLTLVLSVLLLSLTASASAEKNNSTAEAGVFITLKQSDGSEFRGFVAGPAKANVAVLVVHDYFGISDATQQSVKHLGALGYRSLAVDLYAGKSGSSHQEAVKLMQSLDRKTIDNILQAGLDYLKQPGRKLATIGFSMGALESLNATLNDPEAVSATVMIYGSGFDKLDSRSLARLRGPVLVIAGAEDSGATQSAINFFSNMRQVNRPYEMLIYPGADHGYAQPLFNEGKNYNAEAVRATWVLVDDFIAHAFSQDVQPSRKALAGK
jgi:carboxymethylenebutenolidase